MCNSGFLIVARRGPAAEAGPTRKWLASLVLIATGYFLAGRLGQLLAVPPSYAPAIWPASGIALAGVLLAGYRVWPGIFLGALLVNGWTPLSDADGIWVAVGALLVSGSISAGATIQALLGAFLVRRFVGFPNPLTRDRSILAFLVLSGPLACLVGASWRVATVGGGRCDRGGIPTGAQLVDRVGRRCHWCHYLCAVDIHLLRATANHLATKMAVGCTSPVGRFRRDGCWLYLEPSFAAGSSTASIRSRHRKCDSALGSTSRGALGGD